MVDVLASHFLVISGGNYNQMPNAGPLQTDQRLKNIQPFVFDVRKTCSSPSTEGDHRPSRLVISFSDQL